MAPILNIAEEDFERASKLLELANVDYSVPKENNSDFFYVPSIKLNVAKQRILQGKNWFEVHKELQSQGNKMITLPEFIEVLKYTRENLQEVYRDITEVRSPWRAEWIDTDFKVKDGELYVNSNHVLDSDGNLVPEYSKPISRTTLIKDTKISLDSWIDNHTKQGFPSKKTQSGNLHYWNPGDDNDSVARFLAYGVGAGLSCYGDPSLRNSNLGVRAVRHE